jgi:uncharacterized protein (TIGR02996 family)
MHTNSVALPPFILWGLEGMQAFLANIHAYPDDPDPKLAYAEWWDQSADPRADLIRAREEVRREPSNREAWEHFLNTAADILGVNAERDRLSAYLWSILDVRALLVHAADCAARVLCIYSRSSPADENPHHAVKACRRFAAREIGIAELHAAAAAAREAANDVDEPACSAASSAAIAAEFFIPYGADSAGDAANSVVEMVAGPERAEAEASWQAARLFDLWLYGWDYPLPVSELNAFD